MENLIEMRLDKWLKVARFYKRREEAVTAIDNGWVKVNGDRVKPSKNIKVGDLLTIKIENRYHECTITKLTMRSLSATLAKELYESKEQELPKTVVSEFIEIWEEQDKQNRREWRAVKESSGKKERRKLSEWKYGKE